MSVIHVIVIVLTVIVALLLVGIVLIQKSKGGGLSSQFGGASAVLGVAQTNTLLEKITWWLAGILVFLSVVSAYTMPQISTGAAIRSQQSAPAPDASNQFETPELPINAPVEAPVEPNPGE